MNNPEQSGIVYLEDLPQEEVFIQLKPDFSKILEEKIRMFGINKLENEIDSGRIVGHWLERKNRFIRLDILKKVCNLFKLDFKIEILALRGDSREKIINPILPFNFNFESGFCVVAGILGDGGIPSNRLNPYYTNTKVELTEGFIEDMKTVFGKLDYYSKEQTKENSKITVLEFSSLIRKVFLKIGLKAGKKVETNPEIPKFIFNGSDKLKFAFISQIIDDEGCVNPPGRHIKIGFNVMNYHDGSNILNGLKNILNSLGIKLSVYKQKATLDSRDNWEMQINGQMQLRFLYNNLKLRNIEKSAKLIKILENYKQEQYLKRDCKEIYLGKMSEFEQNKGYFNSEDLANSLNRKVGHVRNMLFKYNHENVIIKIEEPRLTPYGSLNAKYIINKNE